jgi:hypothetical protein
MDAVFFRFRRYLPQLHLPETEAALVLSCMNGGAIYRCDALGYIGLATADIDGGEAKTFSP